MNILKKTVAGIYLALTVAAVLVFLVLSGSSDPSGAGMVMMGLTYLFGGISIPVAFTLSLLSFKE